MSTVRRPLSKPPGGAAGPLTTTACPPQKYNGAYIVDLPDADEDPSPAIEKACHAPCTSAWAKYEECAKRIEDKPDGHCTGQVQAPASRAPHLPPRRLLTRACLGSTSTIGTVSMRVQRVRGNTLAVGAGSTARLTHTPPPCAPPAQLRSLLSREGPRPACDQLQRPSVVESACQQCASLRREGSGWTPHPAQHGRPGRWGQSLWAGACCPLRRAATCYPLTKGSSDSEPWPRADGAGGLNES